MRYRYRSDDELKDSGVEWIGKIPKDWEVIRGKFLFDNKKIKNSGAMNNVLSLTLNGVIDRDINNFEGLQPESFDGYQEFKKDNLVFKLIDLENISTSRVGLVHRDGLMSPAYIRLEKKKDINVKYYYYNYFDYYKKNIFNFLGSVGVRSALNSSDLLEMEVLNLEKQEQEKIANFLEEKTSQFDLIISKKERLIERLEEAKKSLISEVVTGKVKVVKTNDGYELVKRSNEEMKDSGVEWIGEIPKDWEVKPLYTNFIENKLKNKDNLENNVLSLSYGKIKRRDIESNLGLLPETFSNYQIVNSGDLIFRLTDLQNDKKSLRVGLVKERGIITSAYIGLKIMTGIEPYFYYLFHFYDLKKLYYNLGAGVRQSMTFADLKKIPYIKPHINEQNEIANYLDFIMNKYDNIINKNKLHIEKLKEAKQSLISEAVTGKIEILD